VKNLTNFN